MIHTEEQSTFFYLLSQTINAFRMPSFFFLSGFLSTMLLLRKGPRLFLQLSPAHCDSVADDSVVYIGVLAIIAGFSKTAGFKLLHSMLNRMPFWLMLILLPLLTVCFVGLSRVGVPVYSNLLGSMTLITLFQYFPFFMVGCLAYANEALFEKFTSQRLPVLLLWACIALALGIRFPHTDSMLASGVTIYLEYSINWLCICAFFSCFRLVVRRVTPLWKYLSDASYTVYLFHHFVVVCLGLVFIDLAIPAPIGFALIVSATLAITFFVHSFIIARYPALALLFNGTRQR